MCVQSVEKVSTNFVCHSILLWTKKWRQNMILTRSLYLVQDHVEIYNNWQHYLIFLLSSHTQKPCLVDLSSCWLGWWESVFFLSCHRSTADPAGAGTGQRPHRNLVFLLLGHDWLQLSLGQQSKWTADRQTWLGFGLIGRGAKLPHSITLHCASLCYFVRVFMSFGEPKTILLDFLVLFSESLQPFQRLLSLISSLLHGRMDTNTHNRTYIAAKKCIFCILGRKWHFLKI